VIYRNFDGKETLEHEWFEAKTIGDIQPQPAKEIDMNIWNIALLLAIAVIAFVFGMATGLHAQTYQTYGNLTYGSDGSSAQTYGSTTYYQPPPNFNALPRPAVVCQTYGTMTVCN
jgi:hypothetical protein